MQPLADRFRPATLDDIVGQQHLLGAGKPLRKIIESGVVPNLIFYGPSGVGKTTLATYIANKTNKTLKKLNGTTASTADIKAVVAQLDTFAGMNGILLYLDEIQYFNKKQQQSLLEYIENGKISLIASTTENPYFYVYSAVLSRSAIFEFKPVSPPEMEPAVRRAIRIMEEKTALKADFSDEAVRGICYGCGGDVRKAVSSVELLFYGARSADGVVRPSDEDVKLIAQKSAMKYDREGDQHFDAVSALMKSLRGSDPDAALHYLARLLEAGDLAGACRRILCSASEDIGMAYPQAAAIVKACVDSALQLGMPEARLPLAEAVILLATAPKSNSVVVAIDRAMADVKAGKGGTPPRELQNVHADGAGFEREQGYLYPHDFPNHWVRQQYLPDTIKNAVYYEYGDNKTELAAKAYWDKIKNEK